MSLDNPWLSACLSRRMLDVASEYLQLWPKLEYLDLWYSLPVGEGADRKASQIWHRDFDDSHLLKAFLYLVDVDEATGPFEYVPGSQPGGEYGGVHPVGADDRRPRFRGEDVQARPGRLGEDVHSTARDDDLLQYVRPTPRRLRGVQAPRARDGDVLLAGVAGLAHRPELQTPAGVEHGRPRLGRRVRPELKDRAR